MSFFGSAVVFSTFKKLSPLSSVASRCLGNFGRDEDGNTMILGLFVFVTMLAAGGMAVDFMQAERERAQLQYTLDRAILAGAALSQPLDPRTVVEDYFLKSDVDDYNLVVSEPEGSNSITSRRLEANVNSNIKNYFVNMVGVGDLKISARAAAEEKIQNVEISLVLDVSGSMGSNSKMTNMQDAAVEFVQTVLTDDNVDRVSINIIPYNMQVNAGQSLLDNMLVTSEHANSNCVDFTSSQFSETAISDTTTYQRTGHFDPFYRTINHPDVSHTMNDTRLFMCPNDEESKIMVMSQSIADLTSKINALSPGGNTSIDIGVRWGAALLDPSMNSVLSGMVQAGANGATVPAVDPAFSTRPAEYNDTDAIKIMVVMTDGINTSQYTLNPAYASGDSNVWVDQDNKIMSIKNYSSNKYLITAPYNANYYGNNKYGDFNASGHIWYDGGEHDKWSWNAYNFGGGAERLTWPEVWNMMGVKYTAYYHEYAQSWDASDYYSWNDTVMTRVSGGTKNTRMSSACNAAKDNDVVVFTIGFEVTTNSAQVMEDCASSESHFYRVEGIEISDAFNAIAQTIQRLKLTN